MADKPEVILIVDGAWESLGRDASSLAFVFACIGLGIWLDSAAMQWFGAVVAFLALILRAGAVAKNNVYTVDGARKRLDEIEAGK